MKRGTGMAILLALAMTVPPAAWGQHADRQALAAQRVAMEKLDWMEGRWRGEAVMQGREGETRFVHTERVGPALDGTLKVIEGTSHMPDGSVPFHAFAVVSFDSDTGGYTMRSYAQGRAGDFPLTLTDTGYTWEIPAGPATIRYTATLSDGVWRETGARIVEGQPPRPFFEMTLHRLGDTGWPSADPVPPE